MAKGEQRESVAESWIQFQGLHQHTLGFSAAFSGEGVIEGT